MKFRSSVYEIPAYQPGKKYPGIIKLSSNENPLGPSPLAKEAAIQALSQAHVYPDGLAIHLRETIGALQGLETDQLIVGNGSDEVLSLAAAVLIEPGLNAVSLRQTFSQYRYAVRLFGGEMREASIDNDGLFDLDAMRDLVDGKTRLVYLCNPNNPTGTWHRHETIKSFIEKLPEEVLVVMDEAYAEYADHPDFPRSSELLSEFPNLLVTRTFSKIYGLAGFRIGYGMGSRDLIAMMHRAKPPFSNGNLALAAAGAALHDLDFVKKSQQMTFAGRAQLKEFCGKLGLPCFDSQANFLCINTAPSGVDAEGAFAFLNQNGITVRSLASFGLPNHIRITIGSPEQMEEVCMALDMLAKLKAEGSRGGGR